MPWSHARRLEAVRTAPIGAHVSRPDTRVVARPGWYQTVTPSAKARSSLNEVLEARLDEAEAVAVIDATLAAYRASGVSFKWCVGPHDRPADLAARLERRGLATWWAWGMAMEVGRGSRPTMPAGVTTEIVGPDEPLEAYAGVMAEGWGSGRRCWRISAPRAPSRRRADRSTSRATGA